MENKKIRHASILAGMSAFVMGRNSLGILDQVQLKSFDEPTDKTEQKERIPIYQQTVDRVSGVPAVSPVPAGCKEYFFNANGGFHNGEGVSMAGKKAAVYQCVAINDKSAVKKFKKNYKPTLL